LQYEMRKLKGGMRRSKLSTRRFIPWFGLPQRRPYIHVVEAITKSIASGNQVYSVNTITVTLILLSTKELAHKGRDSPRPPYKVSRGGEPPNAPRGRHTKILVDSL